MTVLELKKAIDDYIEAGGDKHCQVYVNQLRPENTVDGVEYVEDEYRVNLMGGLMIR